MQVLYLHGNVIAKLSDAGKLAALPKLTKLTLHGNPVCGAPAYRMYLPAHLPRLKSLDFGCITKARFCAFVADVCRGLQMWCNTASHQQMLR